MKLQQEEHEEPEINLTSLIDVVFLLLIFFMVSTTFERQALLRLELPEASTAETETLPEIVEFIVTDDGRLFIGDQDGDQELVDARQATVQAAIAQRFRDKPDAALVVRADGEAPHRLVVRVLDSAAAEGIRQVKIAAIEGEAQ